MDKSSADKDEFRAIIGDAVRDLDAIGDRPVGARGPFGPRIHPDEGAWEASVIDVGRRFLTAACQAAERGNAVAAGYIAGRSSDHIDARWSQAIRAMAD